MNELMINKEDLLYNINEIKKKIDKTYTIIAVVKGNAYGLGIVEFTKFLIKNGITFFAVADYQEAIILRKEIKESILLLTPYKDEELIKNLILKDITLTVDSYEQFKLIEKICKNQNKKTKIHIKIDTGLSRYGFKIDEIDIIKKMANSKNVILEGIYSHFSNSLASNSFFTKGQFNQFKKVIDKLEEEHITFKLKHICNSSGFFKYPNMHLNAARIGSAFIGYGVGIKNNLKKIGYLKTKVTKIRVVKKDEYIGYGNSYKVNKDIKVAILPIGYFLGIGLLVNEHKFRFKSKLKQIFISIKELFNNKATIYTNCGNLKVLGQIGMHDIVIDIEGKNIKENDVIEVLVKPSFIDSSCPRVYR